MSNLPGQSAILTPAPSSSLGADPWAQALFTFSQIAATKKQRRQPAITFDPPKSGAAAAPVYLLTEAAPQLANPLAPLRARDTQALVDIFADPQMAAIEADVLSRLRFLVPEPIWEVEPFEFLEEFLHDFLEGNLR
ncbi:MAG: hypothetical protein ACFCVD_16530 [Nodosilinea sp.]